MSTAGFLRPETFFAFSVALLLGLALLAMRPPDRGSTRSALVLFGAAAIAEIAAIVADAQGAARPAGILGDIAVIAIGVVLIRLAGLFLFRVALPAVRVRVAQIAQDLVTIGLLIGWGIAWLRLTGVDPTSLFTTSAVITAVIAFSMQDTLGNLLGGVVLQLDDSITVGDWVKLDDVSGRVTDIRWRHTAIETRNHETIIVPNSWLMKNRFTVLGAREDEAVRWRRWVWFQLDLDTTPTEVCRVLAKAATEAEIAHVLRDPPPSAVLMDTSDGVARYALRYWLDDPREDDPTDSAVRTHALAALARNGIRLAVRREEHLVTKENDARRSAQQAAESARRRAALDGVDLFTALSPEEKNRLVEHLVYAPFAKGDIVTRQGAVAHWLYLIVAGEADIWLETAAGRRHIAVLVSGTIFGEMGMLTGAPRRATVTARTDLVCYRLDKAGFETVLHDRPDIADGVSRVLAAREAELEAQRSSTAGGADEAPCHADILASIRSFFGLT
jgi:small-conductance mechanosensitive channel